MAVVWGAGAPAWHLESSRSCVRCVGCAQLVLYEFFWLMDLCFAGAALLAAFLCLHAGFFCIIACVQSCVKSQDAGCGTASAVCRPCTEGFWGVLCLSSRGCAQVGRNLTRLRPVGGSLILAHAPCRCQHYFQVCSCLEQVQLHNVAHSLAPAVHQPCSTQSTPQPNKCSCLYANN